MEQDRGFAVQELAGKGKGIVALQPFSQGDVVLAEAPLFALWKEDLAPGDAAAILAALSLSMPKQREAFYELHNRKAEDNIPHEQGIFETNNLPCGAGGTQSALVSAVKDGIFLLASRFNSSCAPNVHYTWDDETGQLVFRTAKDVSPGEELCIAYGNTLAERDKRQKELQARFGFMCVCEACTLSGQALEESNFRRLCLSGMIRDYNMQGVDGDPMQGLGEVMLALRYLREEGLVAYASVFYRAGFTLCAAVSDFTNAQAWARKAYQLWRVLFGERKAESWKTLEQDPRTCEQASTCRRRTLAGPDALAWGYLGLA